jgi:hypothetical protein
MSDASPIFMASEAQVSTCAFIDCHHKDKTEICPQTLKKMLFRIREHFICIEDLFESGMLTDEHMRQKLRKSVVHSVFNSNVETHWPKRQSCG